MPLITLGDDNQLKLKIPSKGDLNWSDDFKTQFAQKIVEHDHTGIDGKGKQLTGDSLADGSINRASLMAIDLQDLPNVTDTYSDPNDINTLQYADGNVLKYNEATNTWIPGPEGDSVKNISQTAQVVAFGTGTVVVVNDIDNLTSPNQYVLDFTGQSSFKSIFLLINLSNPTTQKVILPSMEACTIVSNVDVDLEGDLINCDITVRREGGLCTTTMGSTSKMEGCEGDFDRLISGAHAGSDLSRFIQSTITADELQTQLTNNNSNTLVVDQSEVIIDLLSNSSSLTTSSQYLKLQNKAQVTVKQFDATFPIDSTRVNLADAKCLLLSRSSYNNNLTAWNGTRFNHLASPSGYNKFITADSNGDPVEYSLSNGHVLKGGALGFTSEEYKLANLDDVSLSSTNTSSNYMQPIGLDTSDNTIKKLDYIDCVRVEANSYGVGNATSLGTSGINSTATLGLTTSSNYANGAACKVYSCGGTWISGREVRLNFDMSAGSGNTPQQLIIEAGGNGSNNIGGVYSKWASNNIYHYATTTFDHSSSEYLDIKNASSTINYEFVRFGSKNGAIRNWSGGASIVEFLGRQSTPSDYRLKENISLLENSIDKIKQLKPVEYTLKDSDDKKDIGFIAHEVQEVVPEIVSGKKDAIKEDGTPEYQSVSYGNMTALLTSALQEALVKIDSLEARIKELEDKE